MDSDALVDTPHGRFPADQCQQLPDGRWLTPASPLGELPGELPAQLSPVALLAQAGMTPAEIAAELGRELHDVLADPDCPQSVTSRQVARVEQAAVAGAVGPIVWREVLSRDGEVVRLRTQLPPDTAAAKALLAAHAPERYSGQGDTRLTVTVVTFGQDGTRHAGPVVDGQVVLGPPPPGSALLGGGERVVGSDTLPPPGGRAISGLSIAAPHNTGDDDAKPE